MIQGHVWYHLGIHNEITEPFKYITFLRNPIERIISFYYLRFEYNPDSPNIKLSFAEWLNNSDSVMNMQVKTLSSFNEAHQRILSPEAFLSAKQNLKNYFKVFGITERYNESMVLLNRELGFRIWPFYKKENVTKSRPKITELPKQIVNMIERYNEQEMELYEYANKLFDEMISRQDGTFRVEVEAMRGMNEQMALTDYTDAACLKGLNELGEKIYQMGNTHRAIQIFNQAANQFDNSALSFNNLGVLYFNSHEYERAEENLKKALLIDPTDEDAIYNYAEMRKYLGMRAPIMESL